MRIPNRPIIFKFLPNTTIGLDDDIQEHITKILSYFYKHARIDFTAIDHIENKKLIHSLITVKSDVKEDSWNLKICLTKIPHFFLIFIGPKSSTFLGNVTRHDTITSNLLKNNDIDIFISYKGNSIIRKMFPFFLISSSEGQRAWVYIYEKIHSIPILTRAFEEENLDNKVNFAQNMYELISPIFVRLTNESTIQYRQCKKEIAMIFKEYDELIFNTINKNEFNNLLNPFSLKINEWINCEPLNGIYWRNVLRKNE